jgi:FlaA1/EpsC-like NDP-sugar epimerase
MPYRLHPLLNSKYRMLLLIVTDFSISILSLVLSSIILNPQNNLGAYLLSLMQLFILISVIKIAFFSAQKLYSISWRYASLNEINKTSIAVSLSSIICIICFFNRLSTSLLIIDFFIFNFIFFSSRFTIRWIRHKSPQQKSKSKKNILIIGAGDAGELVARELKKTPHLHHIVGFLDDNSSRHNKTIHQALVLGNIASLSHQAKIHRIDQVIIAVPSANPSQFRQILNECKLVDIPFLTTPSLQELFNASVTLDHLRDVSINDLLGRTPINIDITQIKSNITQKSVLITGAGGSIGSEIARQLISFSPTSMLLVDHSEFHLYSILMELNKHPKSKDVSIIPLCLDIKLADALHNIFDTHRPDIVFHSAAYKHVPLMEINTDQAILNNIGGTKHVIDCCDTFKVKQCIVISTDKAVEPSNAMGATKRLCELMTLEKNKTSSTDFCCVRFGNVLGSYGSVIPLFKDQIKHGGPITITDPNMSRYFMTITEAVSLVFQASTLTQLGGKLYVLNMGNPIKITQLASDLIRLSGLTDQDIPIKYTGLRPGEKLTEKLFYDFEIPTPTHHPKINCCNVATSAPIRPKIDHLLSIATSSEKDVLLDILLTSVTDLNHQIQRSTHLV